MSTETASDLQVLLAARKAARLNARAERAELEFLTMARARGWTWQKIAGETGRNSPQSAQQRYDRLRARALARQQEAPAHLRACAGERP